MSELTVEPYHPFPSFDQFEVTNFASTAYDLFAGRLSEARATTSAAQLDAAVEKATRAAAADTGAIEGLYQVDRGFTMSVAAEAAAWDNIHEVKGESVARAINDALHGYQYVMDLATKSKRITEAWIRELHSVLCASQKTYKVITSQGEQEHKLPLGEYKSFPNNPLNLSTSIVHSYAPVSDTPAEMQRLTEQLTSASFHDAHPVIQAAYAHYAFVCIHPFADGNGRVARALASVYLYRRPGVPLVIFADQKGEYLDALEMADSGRYEPFATFIGDRALDTVRMVLTDLRSTVPRERRESRLQQLQESLMGRGGLAHTEIDALGVLLIQEMVKAAQWALGDSPPPAPIRVTVQHEGASPKPPMDDFRTVPGGGVVSINAQAPKPMDVALSTKIAVFIAKPQYTACDFIVVSSREVLGEFFLRDLHPTVGETTTYTLRAIAGEVLWKLVDQAATKAEETLANKGYR